MKKMYLRKYQFVTILKHLRDDLNLKTVDEIINDIEKDVKDDMEKVLTWNDNLKESKKNEN